MRERIARFLVYLDRAKRVLWYVQAWAVLLVLIKVAFTDSALCQWFFSHLLIVFGSFLLLPMIGIVIGFIEKKYTRALEKEDLDKTDPGHQDVMETLYGIYSKML